MNQSIARVLTKGRTSTIIIAASNSSSRSKKGADYVCDGVDDQVEIQAAITSLSTVGGKILLLEGTFVLSATLTLANYVTLEGQGNGTKIQQKSATDLLPLILIGNGVDGAAICKLRIDGNKSTLTWSGNLNQALIKIYNANNIIIDRIYCYNHIGTAIYYVGDTSIFKGPTITNSSFLTGYHGVYLDTRGEYCRISNCLCVDNTRNGIQISGAGNVTINDCNIKGNYYGLYIDSASGANFSKILVSNSMMNHNLIGIYLHLAYRVAINNCNVIANNHQGIFLEGSNKCSITGGVVGANSQTTTNTWDDIHIASITNFPAVKNIINGVIIDNYGASPPYSRNSILEADENCDYNIITNCVGIKGATDGIVTVGVNTITANNLVS